MVVGKRPFVAVSDFGDFLHAFAFSEWPRTIGCDCLSRIGMHRRKERAAGLAAQPQNVLGLCVKHTEDEKLVRRDLPFDINWYL